MNPDLHVSIIKNHFNCDELLKKATDSTKVQWFKGFFPLI